VQALSLSLNIVGKSVIYSFFFFKSYLIIISFLFLDLVRVVIWAQMEHQRVTVMTDMLDEDAKNAHQVIQEILYKQETIVNEVNVLDKKKV